MNYLNFLVEAVLSEGNISISAVDLMARQSMERMLKEYCRGEWNLIKSRYPELDPNDSDMRMKMYDSWYDDDFRAPEKRLEFVKGIAWQISRELTKVTNKFILQKIAPHLRDRQEQVRVVVEIREDASDQYSGFNGYYQDFNKLIKVFIDADIVEEAGLGALHDWIFGEGEGIENFIDAVIPTFVHEFTHYEQWKRGQAGKRTRGYISTGGTGKNPFVGDHHSAKGTEHQQMRYTGSAHEIESFAAGAAVQLTQGSRRHQYGEFRIELDDSQINDICQDIALCYNDVSQMKRYLWLRQYRDHYVEQGFKGHELETVFRRFMKSLYQKLQQYRKKSIGKNHFYGKYPAQWETYAKAGMASAIEEIARDYVVDPKVDVESAGAFINNYFFKDEWDFARQSKISNLIKKMAKKFSK